MPSMSHASPPASGSVIRRGARSFHFSGTNDTKSGGVSRCPSPEMTWYLRPMRASSSRVAEEEVPGLVAEAVHQPPAARGGWRAVHDAGRLPGDDHRRGRV